MGHKHQLCDLLIMPVQRITRYPLLLKEVYKYTEQANLIAEVEALQQARQTMEDIAKAANDIMDISRLQGFDVSNLFFHFLFNPLRYNHDPVLSTLRRNSHLLTSLT